MKDCRNNEDFDYHFGVKKVEVVGEVFELVDGTRLGGARREGKHRCQSDACDDENGFCSHFFSVFS